ncbi:MAG: sigma-70 family RNA polymerase sigma factor [Labedaea sp.]
MTAVDGAPRGRDGHGASGDALPARADSPDLPMDDRALLERLRAGEDAAFGELFARHAMAVRRLAYGLVSDRSEAEDLTAEAFFRVLQAIRRGSGPVDNVRAYLLTVARRVAWEWRARHRDVPVSDEELNHRAGAGPDAAGQSTERNLIRRAFTSLPERWRSVLWKVEVEGERPAVVATNFGLSANATAALARRARQGLRAAYLQAHLAAERSSTGCRDVLEKLGAYTAGSIRGAERRRIGTHLAGCTTCTAMHAELRDVCSGLRAHAALLAAPLVAVASTASVASKATAGLTATVKGLFTSAKVQVALATSSAAAVGVFGLVLGPLGSGNGGVAMDDLDGERELELVISGAPPASRPGPETIVLTTGALSTVAVVPRRIRRGDGEPAGTAPAAVGPAGVVPATAAGYDEGARVMYRDTSVEQRSEVSDGVAMVYETTTVTEVNAAEQTRVLTQTTRYTTPAAETGTPLMLPDPSSSALSSPAPTKPTKQSVSTTSKRTTPAPTKSTSGPHPGVP